MSKEDIILWPDGTICFAEELDQYGWKSDDYERIEVGTPRWHELGVEHELFYI
jgi:hypothetical protein